MPAFLAAIPAIASAIGAAGSAVGGAVGNANAASDRDSQRRLLQMAMDEYGRIDLPTLERIAAEQLGPSAMEGVQTDPRLRQDQLGTLDTLDSYSRDGGTAESRAAMNRILADVARQEGAGRNAILGNMRARGVAGSGAELAAQLSNQQASADRAQTAGLDQAAQAQRRMLEAAVQKGTLAGNIRGQDFGENSAKAQARDMINRYNAAGREKAQYYNAGLTQQQFGNRMQLASGKANAAAGVANNYGQTADRTAAMGAGIGSGLGQVAASFGQQYQDNQRRDEDREFMKDMWGSK